MYNEIKISVIFPVYNVEAYVEESLASLCQQTFDSYEIIIVNDGSNDCSMDKVQKVIQDYPEQPIKIITQENKGLSAARNFGLRESAAKYVIFVDSDDIVTPDFLEQLYNICESNNLAAAFCDYEITYEKNRAGFENWNWGNEIIERNDLLYRNMMRDLKIAICSIMLNRDFIYANNLIFDESLRFGEEVDYTWRLYATLGNIGYIKKPMYKYLQRKGSLMNNQHAEKVIFLLNHMHNVICKLKNEKRLTGEKIKWIESKIYFEKMHAFGHHSNYQNFKYLLTETNYKKRFSELKNFPDRKVAVVSCIACYSKRLSWIIFRTF